MKRPTARKTNRDIGGLLAEPPAPGIPVPGPVRPATVTPNMPEPPAAAATLIGIQVEPDVPAGKTHGRHDFILRGRVVATARIADILLLAGDERHGQLTYGQAEATTRLVLPDGAAAMQHNFVFQLPSEHAEDTERTAFSIIVRTDDDGGAKSDFEIDFDPEQPATARVATGPVVAGISSTGSAPAIILHAEHVTLDSDGNLRVGGWAVSQEMLVGIRISVDDDLVGSAVLGGARQDVANVHQRNYPNARNSGFTLSAPIGGLASGARRVCIQATTLAGSVLETIMPIEQVRRPDIVVPVPALRPMPAQTEPIKPAQVADPATVPEPARPPADPDPRRAISLYCDEVSLGEDGILVVRGWAVSTVGIAGISVLLDDVPVGDAEIGQPRLDVGDKFRDIASARFSGFRLRNKVQEAAGGMHVVTVAVRNGLDDVRQHHQAVAARRIERPATPPQPPPTARLSPPSRPTPKTFEFKLDAPELTAGVMTQLVTGRLMLEGWVIGRTGIADIEVLLDEQLLGSAHYGLARRDIAKAHPEWPDALRCGFAFQCPPRAMRDGDHVLSLRITARDGTLHNESFRLTVAKVAATTEFAGIKRHMSAAEAALHADILRRLDWQPWFRLVLRGADPRAPERLVRTLSSLESQVYPYWRADLLGDGPELRAIVAGMVADGQLGEDRVGFLGESAISLEIAPGNRRGPVTLAGVMSCGDRLGCDALSELAVQSGINPDAEMLYADEIRQNQATGQREAFFKPAFSPDLLLTTNYIGRPWVATPSLLARAGASARSLREIGEYDLLLRCAERVAPGAIHAVPRLLCDSASGTTETPEFELRALRDATARRGIEATIEPGCLPGVWRTNRRVSTEGKVSIIVITAGVGGFVRTCLSTLKQDTAYPDIEIVAVDNIPPDAPPAEATKAWLRDTADIVLDRPGRFNWSRFANHAAEAATGDFLLFLDDDTAVLEPGWLDAMMEHARRPEIGIIGARLLYPDDKVQNAGVFLTADSGARPAFRFTAADEPGYFGLARTQRNVLAVSGSCMLMRRETFAKLDGFDEAYAASHADLDFCLRAHAAGLLNLITPEASLRHHEGASRTVLQDSGDDLDRFKRDWQMRLALGDPYFNPNLSQHFDDFRPNDEPARTVTSRPPLFGVDDIQRILVIKADEAGDFVTTLRAIRRLREHFPEAWLAVLAAPATRPLAALEPAIDEVIDFAFVATRSAHGKREADPEELAALTAELVPQGFDLAIDLCKHPDTRPLLRCAGAKFTAGFDHLGRFPWLDVALEWEGNRRLQRKRAHVSDDLLYLVEAVANAARDERPGLDPQEVVTLQAETAVPASIKRFLGGTVVCVDPAATGEMRQWPVGHFAALIDLLVSRNQVRVLLVGAEDDDGIAAAVLEQIKPDARVMSVVGALAPDVLSAVIAGCVVFVGCEGGLTHVAAALGVPTIGVFSGVVDPIEWAPQGATAIAVARAMSCGPCYLTHIEDCPRDHACLRGLAAAPVHRMCEMMLARRVPSQPHALPKRPRAKAPPAAAEESLVVVEVPIVVPIAVPEEMHDDGRPAVRAEPRVVHPVAARTRPGGLVKKPAKGKLSRLVKRGGPKKPDRARLPTQVREPDIAPRAVSRRLAKKPAKAPLPRLLRRLGAKKPARGRATLPQFAPDDAGDG